MTVRPSGRSFIPRLAAISLLTVVGAGRAAPADEVKTPQVEYSAIQAGTGGVNTYVPGKWGILNLEVTNPLDEPHELLSTTYFTGYPTLQFGRRIWVPARSRLRTWQPVLTPQLSRQETRQFEFQSLVLELAHDDEVATRDDTGRVLHSGFLPAQLESPITGMIGSFTDNARKEGEPDMAHELVVAARVSQRLSTRVAGLWDRHYVPDETSLQPLHHLRETVERGLHGKRRERLPLNELRLLGLDGILEYLQRVANGIGRGGQRRERPGGR